MMNYKTTLKLFRLNITVGIGYTFHFLQKILTSFPITVRYIYLFSDPPLHVNGQTSFELNVNNAMIYEFFFLFSNRPTD